MQENWNPGTFRDIAEIIMGQSPEGNTYNREGIGVPLLNGPTEFTERYPVKIQYTSKPTKLCSQGDILVCVRGSSTGRVNISNDVYCIGRGIAAIRANVNSVTPFVEYQLQHLIQKILSATSGSTFPNIDKDSLSKISILIPPKSEQKKIAAILSTWDSLIEKQSKLIKAKEQRKKAFMQKLLSGEVRFRGYEKAKWKKRFFKDVFEFVATNSLSRENLIYDVTETQVYNIHYGDIHAKFKNEILDFAKENEVPFIQDEFVVGKKLSFLKDGDLVIADASEDYSGLGECIEVMNVGDNKVVGGLHVIVARDKSSETINGFRTYLFNNPIVSIELKKLATGVSVYSISKSSLLGLELLIPSIEEQIKIAGLFKALDDELQLLNDKLQEYRDQKKGLMQNLLTGKIRVKV